MSTRNAAPRWPSRSAMPSVLSARLRRLLATAEIAVLIDHERLHAAEIPQRTLLLERLGGPQADPDSLGELGVDEMVDGLHVQHVGHGPLVAHLLSKRTRLVEHGRSPRHSRR